mmetsp:Transcript_47/g.185  ORF Transcript_47/g.185 Transcript_47/m.185 type:complete len:376 (+) Transcript_47:87-1214(+)
MSGGTATPLPMAKIAVLVLVFLGDALCMSVVLPFVPFMVQRFMQFGPGEEHLVGYYAGAIAAAYITGQLCTAALWGALSDRVGRRPVMLLCLALSVACVLAFGAAPNLPFALVVRFAHGLVSGNVVVAKTMLADLTDSTNEAAAFVYVGVTFGAGAILGPLIGGTLSESADKYCALPLAWLWVARPYLLPCAVVAAVVLLDLAFAFFYLEESIETRSDARSESRPRAAGGAKGATAGAVRGEVDNVADLLRDPKSPFFSRLLLLLPLWRLLYVVPRGLPHLRASAAPRGRPFAVLDTGRPRPGYRGDGHALLRRPPLPGPRAAPRRPEDVRRRPRRLRPRRLRRAALHRRLRRNARPRNPLGRAPIRQRHRLRRD